MKISHFQLTYEPPKLPAGDQRTWILEVDCFPLLRQVQAIGMYGAAQPDFFKSETNGGIKNIISYHLKIIKR